MRIPRTTLGALAVMLVASRALADEPTVAPAAPTAPAAPAAPPKTNPSGISEEARMHFAAGVALLQDPEGEKVEDAYRE
ncbi:MAG TPA: hypothetical protein VLT33_27295, partial [Labilithrix sp.]|nr:hypothetical protein [Labilithrix sp.]